MALIKIKNEPTPILFAKIALGLCAVVSFILVSGIALYVFTQNIDKGKALPDIAGIKSIELSPDAKSILNADTKEVILTIDIANKYLKDSGYAYNPDTFQTTNAKYAGDCFLGANLSNNKDRIVFSSGCLAGDLPQAWIGVYEFPQPACSNGTCLHIAVKPAIQFLIGGSGRNFVWSADDKTITYEADLGLSGLTETRTIDSRTGEVLNKDAAVTNNSEYADWKNYTNEKYGFEVTLLDSWKGYSILTESWHGLTLDDNSTQYQGPEIIIRNPKWSVGQYWQDIPVMVFTKEEWKLIEAGNLNVSAAPIGPDKLDENQRYVFALPPRWVGFSDTLGQDEAQAIASTIKAVPLISSESSVKIGITDLDDSIIDVNQEDMPEDLTPIFIKDQKENINQFCLQKQITINDFEFVSESVDLNEDGVKEFIITPGMICKEAIRGASGNGPIIIYQKMDGLWTNIGDLEGNMYAVKQEESNAYKKIVTYSHMSAYSGIVTYYRWNKLNSIYEKEISNEINLNNN